MNLTLTQSDTSTDLAGVHTSMHVACTEHAVIQGVSVHMWSFAFLLRDQENASIQQVVASIFLCSR